jgi:hypothetical protein
MLEATVSYDRHDLLGRLADIEASDNSDESDYLLYR